MRKEIIVAIFAGGIFGLIIAFGLWRLNATVSNSRVENNDSNSPSPTPNGNGNGLSIAKPQELQVHTESSTTITGITKSSSIIAVSAENGDFLAVADEQGGFEVEVDLTGGLNQIVITSFDKSGKEISNKTLLLVYSSEFPLEPQTDAPEESQESTDSADAVRELVQEKVNQAQNVPMAYIGTVTDASEQGLQIRSPEGEILQISISEETTYSGANNAQIAYADIAIGDFILAMGFKNGNGLLNSKRIVVTDPPKEPSRVVIFGTIKEIGTNEVQLMIHSNGEITLVFPRRWKGPDLDELSEEDKLVAFGEESSDGLDIRSIFLVDTNITQE